MENKKKTFIWIFEKKLRKNNSEINITEKSIISTDVKRQNVSHLILT